MDLGVISFADSESHIDECDAISLTFCQSLGSTAVMTDNWTKLVVYL